MVGSEREMDVRAFEVRWVFTRIMTRAGYIPYVDQKNTGQTDQ